MVAGEDTLEDVVTDFILLGVAVVDEDVDVESAEGDDDTLLLLPAFHK